jgi:hypothetical protein
VLGPGELLEEQAEQPLALLGGDVEDVAGEAGVHVQRPLAGLGVDPHDRVVGDQQLVALALAGGGEVAGPRLARAVAVLGPQRVGQPLERRGQALVGGDQAGPGGVAADLGHDVGPQDRGEGRVDRRGHVRVPAHQAVGGGPDVLVLRVAGGEPGDVDRVDLGVAVGRGVVVGMRVGQLAEVAAEPDLAAVVEVLVAEEQHPVAQERRPDRGHGGLVERLGDVEPGDLGADVAGDRADVERGGVEQVGHDRHS